MLREPRSAEHEYAEFLQRLERYFEENRAYLEPLVCEYQDNGFAMQYRGILKEALRQDIGFPRYEPGSREHFVIDTILTAFIETLLQTLRTKQIPLRDSYRLVSGSVQNGVLSTLKDRFSMDLF